MNWVQVPFEVDKKYDGWRVDRFLADRLIGYSRAKVQRMLEDSRITRQDRPLKAHSRVRVAQKIQIAYLRKPEAALAPDAQLPILFEDDHLLVVDKPAGLLSHPTDKIVSHTVLGVLRHSRPDLKNLHLLHRLDRETSGVLALAKTPTAARRWSMAMERREIHKTYLALVHGIPTPKVGTIDRPIGRQPGEIKVRQWVDVPDAVRAVTRYEVILDFGFWISDLAASPLQSKIQNPESKISAVRLFPKTGRLHQIRVHLAWLGHPLLGDPLYTGDGSLYLQMSKGQLSDTEREQKLGFTRTALHAAALRFHHPVTRELLQIEAPLPPDIDETIKGMNGVSRADPGRNPGPRDRAMGSAKAE